MFWKSVLAGFAVLLRPKIYIAALFYFLILEETDYFFSGFSMEFYGMQGAATYFFVLTLFPLLLKSDHKIKWSTPLIITKSAPFDVLGFIVLALIIANLIVYFIGATNPLLPLHPLFTCILGIIAIKVGLRVTKYAYPGLRERVVFLTPTPWSLIGFLGISYVAIFGVYMLSFAVEEYINVFPGYGMRSLGGFIPVVIYASWLRTDLSVKSQ
ncbi:MAG: hypothetical protein ACFFCW_46450 [Candidatus Hodarchaeota archaeon]